MEFIIGCIFLVVTLIILLCFCKNVNLTVEIKYPEIDMVKLEDLYNHEGEPTVNDKNQFDFDNMLKEINDLMLDTEVDSDE